MKSAAQWLTRNLEGLGFVRDRSNSKGFMIYVKPDHPDVSVIPGVSEGAAKALLKKVQRQVGVTVPPASKRKPQQIRRRAEARKVTLQEEIARNRERLASIRRQPGVVDDLALAEIRQIESLIEQREREIAEIEKLMMSAPLGNRARHRSGATS